MVINTNVAALASAQNLNKSTNLLNQSLARLSSGSKITSPADDPAGLAESIALNAQIGETNSTNNNISNAIAFSQTQDGYLQQVSAALNEMATLAVSAQDATKTDTERADYQKEFSALSTYVADVGTKDFNGVSLFSAAGLNVGTDTQGGSFQLGAVAGNYINAPITTSTTTTQGYAGSTTLGQVSSAFNNPAGDYLYKYYVDPSNVLNQTEEDGPLTPSSTINDLVAFYNKPAMGITDSYDSTTGQFSITLQPGATITDVASSTDVSMLKGLDFSGITNFSYAGNGIDDDSYADNQLGTSPMTLTASFTHSTTTTTTTTPSGVPDISTIAGAKSALATVTAAITQLATDRATIGANMERLNYTSQGLSTLQTNLSAANSAISDVDVAEESTKYAREQILVQSGTSMLAQANSSQQSILKLLS